MAGITLKDVSKSYQDDVYAVDKFNLDIADKEFVVFVGPSGCGKSTTLRMIAGLEEITSGEIYIGEDLVNGIQPKDRDIAMVFQSYALYPHMSVYKNMSFALKMKKVDKDEANKRVLETAELLGISHLLKRKPRALSGGESQRVALGRAMVRNPKVFLLDEPLSNLDAKLRTDMRAEIVKLHKELATTFIYVTHDQTEAMTMGDRIVIMNLGHILQVDTPSNIYNYPANIFVAGFIGSPRMNFFDAEISARGGEYFADIDGDIICLNQVNASKETLDAYVGKTVVLGIRPEHISCQIDPRYKLNDLMPELIETLGAETNIHLRMKNGEKCIVREFINMTIAQDRQMSVSFLPDRIHIFDKETEEAVTGASGGKGELDHAGENED